MTRPVIEPKSPGPLANTLTIMPMSGYYFALFMTKLYDIETVTKIRHIE